MGSIGKTLMVVGLVALSITQAAHAANSIVVESKQVAASTLVNNSGEVGIYISNDINLLGMTVALEMRTLSGNAFPAPFPPAVAFTNTTFRWRAVPGNRLDQSPLGVAGDNWPAASITSSRYAVVNPGGNACSGPTSNTYGNSAQQGDAVSPDGYSYGTVSTGNPEFEEIYLAPGIDPQGSPSMHFIFPTGANVGMFEIDTCCCTPALHTVFVNENTAAVVPQFTKGTIDVVNLAVKELETGIIPQDYSLEQNYPNPFNAGTVIRFAQPIDGNVKIDVYNVLGRKVRTLVNEFRSAGIHQTDWDGRSDDGQAASTGVYFYRISAGSFTTTRKMIMLK